MSLESKRLTRRTVDALKTGEIAWDGGDGSVKGFGVRRQCRDRVYMPKVSHWRPATLVHRWRAWLPTRAQTKAIGSIAELCDLYLSEAPTRVLRKMGNPRKPPRSQPTRGASNGISSRS